MTSRLPLSTALAAATFFVSVGGLQGAQLRTVSGSASISGRVESAESAPVPIRRATVTLTSDEANVHITTVADDAGSFQFTGLPASHFTLSAAKAPFVTASFGASGPGKPGTPIVVAGGEARRDVVVRLLRGAAITGTVFDTFGAPAPYQYMSVLRRTLTAAGRSLAAVDARGGSFGEYGGASVTTDDRGIYRFYGLPPGDYIVPAATRSTLAYRTAHQTTADDLARATTAMHAPPRSAGGASGSMILSVGPNGPPPDGVGEVPVFYPGTVTASDAAPVHVDAGEEKAGIDIRIVLSRSGSIDAAFEDASGRPLTGGFSHIVGDELPGGQPVSAQVFPLVNGPLHRPGLSPGRYKIEARGTTTDAGGRSVVLWGSADATVTGGDGPLVSVRLEPAPSLIGRVTFDEAIDAAAMPAIAVTLEPADPVPGSFVAPLTVNADHDRFTFPGVPAARYRLRAADRAGTTAPTSWHIAAATVADHDALDSPFELRAGESPADIVISMTRKRAELAGSFADVSGRSTSAYTIVVFSTDEANWYWNSTRIRGVHLASDGTYMVGDLPAGDYLVAALADVEPADWFDPEFLSRIRPAAVPVKLVAGTRVVQNLKVSGSRLDSR